MVGNRRLMTCHASYYSVWLKSGLTILKGGGPMSNVAHRKTINGSFVTLSAEQPSLIKAMAR